MRIRKSDPATQPPTRPVSEDFPHEMGRRGLRRGVVVGIGFGVVVAGAVTVFTMRGVAPPAPPGVIIVEGSVSALGVSAQPAALADPGTTVPVKTAEPPPTNTEMTARAPTNAASPANAKGAAPKSRSELLTRAFARQQPQIARCFSQHAGDVTGSPEISVRFEVGTDGRVTSAQVQPAALGSTPLGQCITAVAKATDFGPQPDPTPFRIPITAKRGP
jgi:hypothetical protein